jgi:serine/threonine protein kinase
VAAVKRAEIAPSVLASRQAEFQRELETLSQLRHRHLVPFLGFCEVASRELMLVYDFMPNGTLQVGFRAFRVLGS